MSYSDSPTHFDIILLELIQKKVESSYEAIALAIIVFPVPGGPKRRMPLEGFLRPQKRSGLC